MRGEGNKVEMDSTINFAAELNLIENAREVTKREHEKEDARENVLLDENSKLKHEKTCKICMDAEVGVVFLPCGHLVVCPSCAPSLKVRLKCRN